MSRPPVAAAIFDLDGTLVDSEPAYALSDALFFRDWGIDIEGLELTGIGTRDCFLLLEARFPASPLHALALEERIARKDGHFLAAAFGPGKAPPVFPAVAGLARALADRGMPLAIASGSSPAVIEASLRDPALAGLFAARVSSSEVARGKPEPDVFLEAARRLGVEPAACLVLEDSLPGLGAARAAGMRCVVLPPPGEEGRPGFRDADALVAGGPAAIGAGELLALVEALAGRDPIRGNRGAPRDD